jgi:2-isopropylmalate synthase
MKKNTVGKPSKSHERVYIFDTTLRDGEQAPGASLNIDEKIKIAKQLEILGVDIIEAGFPASSPGDFEAVRQISKIVKGSTIAGLARAIPKDIEVAGKALKGAKRGRIHTFISSSDIHLQFQFRKTREEALESAIAAVKAARRYTDDVEFSAMDASRSDWDYLCRMVEAAIAHGATVVNIPDTVGYSIPEEFGRIIRHIKNNVPNIGKAILSVHCHNDLGLSTANSISAIQNGARQVEVAINGMGERAGNASLEEVVMILKTRADLLPYEVGIDTRQIYKTSRLVSSMTGFLIQNNKAIVGANAFAHESGIHQDGVLKHRQTYEIMKPESIGFPATKLVLGKHSGRHAFKKRLEDLGYRIFDEQIQKLFEKFKVLADKKKNVYDEDIEALAEENVPSQDREIFVMTYLHTSAGTTTLPTATLKLKKGDAEVQEAATGDGPVDAVFNAIDRATGFKGKLSNYTLKALTQGRDAQGEVSVTLSAGGREAHGRGVSTDVIEASAKAYLNGVNKIMLQRSVQNTKGLYKTLKGI